MGVDNPCFQAQRCTACCSDSWISFAKLADYQAFSYHFPEGYHVDKIDSEETFIVLQGFAGISQTALGIVHYHKSGEVWFQFFQSCPFLAQGLCSIYDEPYRPIGCRDFDIGGKRCNRLRSDNGLPSITME
jgi:Fe-S-cluster containining protein